jgi:nuclear protein localization family protein 4
MRAALARRLKRVGWIFSTSNTVARDFPLSGSELLRTAALQAAGGEFFVTAVVSLVEDEEGTTSVHFEAFQASAQAAKLVAEGWLIAGSDDPKFVAVNPKNPEAVIVAGRDVTKVEVEFLLTVVPIMDHEGPLRTNFPVENRLTGQSADDLKACLQATKGQPYAARLTDFHMLLFLSNVLDLNTDVALLCEAVRTQGPVQDGYTLLIESIAGLS